MNITTTPCHHSTESFECLVPIYYHSENFPHQWLNWWIFIINVPHVIHWILIVTSFFNSLIIRDRWDLALVSIDINQTTGRSQNGVQVKLCIVMEYNAVVYKTGNDISLMSNLFSSWYGLNNAHLLVNKIQKNSSSEHALKMWLPVSNMFDDVF